MVCDFLDPREGTCLRFFLNLGGEALLAAVAREQEERKKRERKRESASFSEVNR